MNIDPLVALSFVACVLVVLALAAVVSDVIVRDRSPLARRMRTEFATPGEEAEVRNSPLFRDRPDWATLNGNRKPLFRERVETWLDQSAVHVTVAQLIGLSAAVGLVVALVVGGIRQSPLIGLLAGLLAACLPVLYVEQRRAARLTKLARQLPDAFDLMARVVRAGQTPTQAIAAVAAEFDPPISAEFAFSAEQQKLGLPAELALRNLSRRTGLLEIRIFILALLVQQQTGGNLAEVLEKLAAVVRERFRTQAKIRSLTAEGRMQAIALVILPFAVMGLMMLLSQRYAATVMQNPWLIGVMLAMVSVGWIWIRQVVKFRF